VEVAGGGDDRLHRQLAKVVLHVVR
jgi:hypothetical protein